VRLRFPRLSLVSSVGDEPLWSRGVRCRRSETEVRLARGWVSPFISRSSSVDSARSLYLETSRFPSSLPKSSE